MRKGGAKKLRFPVTTLSVATLFAQLFSKVVLPNFYSAKLAKLAKSY